MQKIEYLPLEQLKPDENNPRTINDRQFQLLCDSIRNNREYFETRPILVNKDMVIFAGNMRYRAAKEIGLPAVPVAILDITPEKQQELMLRDNIQNGEWDMDMLSAFDPNILRNVGFEATQLSKMGFPSEEEDEEVTRAALESTEPPVAKLGEIYQLGRHRLMCGDSCDPEAVDKLMAEARAQMVFTDPPWNVAIGEDSNPKHRQREGLMNDNLGENFPEFLNKLSVNLVSFCDGDIYCVMGCEEWPNIHKALTDAGAHWSSTIVWVKDVFVLGRSKYHRRYEPIWYGWRDKSSYSAGRDQDDVWEIPRPKISKEHPTMKPVELVTKAIHNSSEVDGIVLDLFGGSGTTLIAAEQNDRRCFMMELDPKYIDVIIKRWEKISGQKATRL